MNCEKEFREMINELLHQIILSILNNDILRQCSKCIKCGNFSTKSSVLIECSKSAQLKNK